MGETPDDVKSRVAELEKKLGRANNRSLLAVLMALLSTGLSVWLWARPVREIRLAGGDSVLTLTPVGLEIEDTMGTAELRRGDFVLKDKYGSLRLGARLMWLEKPGGMPLVRVGELSGAGVLSLHDENDEAIITAERFSELMKAAR